MKRAAFQEPVEALSGTLPLWSTEESRTHFTSSPSSGFTSRLTFFSILQCCFSIATLILLQVEKTNPSSLASC
ncbi:hypothetical protein HKD37_07G019083 [Glycine soja]|nr:hypothetical protein GmHk_07G019371 [Glycine max]